MDFNLKSMMGWQVQMKPSIYENYKENDVGGYT